LQTTANKTIINYLQQNFERVIFAAMTCLQHEVSGVALTF